MNSGRKNTIPAWAEALTAIGEWFSTLAGGHSSQRVTVALCLPCISYAAAFVGLGIVKKRISAPTFLSEHERLNSLLGKWVCIGYHSHPIVGILSWCPVEKTFEIKQYIDKTATELHEIEKKFWAHIRPTGRDFDPNRKLSLRQIQKIAEQNSSISTLSLLLECDLWEQALKKSGCIFSIYGNKSRLIQELSESLFANEEAVLSKIIRPKGHADSGDSFHCTLEAVRSTMPDQDGAPVIIEAGRALADQLAASRKLNRVILLARNAADYDDSAGQIMEAYSLSKGEAPEMNIQLPSSIKLMKFYHK